MRNPFRKTAAQVYVSEIRRGLDSSVVPVFTPDSEIDVGDFGSFENGRFVRRGNLRDRNVDLDVRTDERAPFTFKSEGKVKIEPMASVPGPTGELARASIKFQHAKAVVASFKGGVERSVKDADAFGETIAGLWARNELRSDRVVVWSVRTAVGGTVVVSENGSHELEVSADAAALASAGVTLAGLPGLAVGVDFGGAHAETWTLSEADCPLVLWARLLALDAKTLQAVDRFGFEPGTPEFESRLAKARPVAFSTDDLLAQLS